MLLSALGYYNYAVVLLCLTGWLILAFDVKAYKASGLKKEIKAARILGWFNVVLGGMMFITILVIRKWFI